MCVKLDLAFILYIGISNGKYYTYCCKYRTHFVQKKISSRFQNELTNLALNVNLVYVDNKYQTDLYIP